jgi:hypothetical protein
VFSEPDWPDASGSASNVRFNTLYNALNKTKVKKNKLFLAV